MAYGAVETTLTILVWMGLNIAISTSTKWIFLYGKICEDGTDNCEVFEFPLTITVLHMVFSWGMCWLQLRLFHEAPKAAALGLREQARKIAPLAVCFAASVAMGNLSLKYIYPSFSQMLGSMAPLITVGLAVAMQGQRFNCWTWASMPVICGGLVLCSAAEVNFNAVGALYCFGSTVLRALKSIVQGKLLEGAGMDSVTLLYYMAPWAALLLQAAAFAMEGLEPFRVLRRGLIGGVGADGLADPFAPAMTGGPLLVALLIASGLNACLLNVFTFKVTACTSAVTLQVLGNVKACLSIGVSVVIFGNPLTWEQAVGVLICLFGVWIYNRKGGRVSAAAGGAQEPEGASKGAAQKAPAATSAAKQKDLSEAELAEAGYSRVPVIPGVPAPAAAAAVAGGA